MESTRRKPQAENLTPRRIAALKPGDEVWDTVVSGFHVRRGERRTTYWLRYRLHGAQRRYKLGAHPVLTLAKARKSAKDALEKVLKNEDPAGEREEARDSDLSFRAMAREVLDFKAAPDPRTGQPKTREATRKERERILAAELLPAWGKRPASSITRRDVILLLDRVALRGNTMRNRTLALIQMLYTVALRERSFPGVESHPAIGIKKLEEGDRKRYLSRDEMRTLWRALDVENPTTRNAVRMIFLTAQRVASVVSMRWKDVDDADVWRIPRENFKGDREHWVPLSKEALAVLEAMRPLSGKDEYVFPGRADGEKPHLVSLNKALQRIVRNSGLPAFTLHDARRTFRTHATTAKKPAHPKDPTGLGIDPAHADALLGHKDQSLGATRYQGDVVSYRLAEKREAAEAWGAWVREAVEG